MLNKVHHLETINSVNYDDWLFKAKLLCLTFLSRLWPILQVIAHHIHDKLAVSFDSSSIGRTSYKWFLTIDAKYSFWKTYNKENLSF